mgnify:CR=1 FL=1
MTHAQIARGASYAVLGLGLLLTLRALQAFPSARDRLAQKLDDVRTLEQLREEKARIEAARLFLGQLPNTTPEPLRELLARVLPSVQAGTHQRETLPLTGGWVLRRADVTLDAMPLRDLNILLGALRAPAARPPWRLVECRIAAVDQQAGSGRITLGLVAVEKPAAPPSTLAQ